MDKWIPSGRTAILFSLAEVPSMDSAGSGGLTAACRGASDAGGKARLLNAERRVFDIPQRVRLDSLFESHVDEAAARASID